MPDHLTKILTLVALLAAATTCEACWRCRYWRSNAISNTASKPSSGDGGFSLSDLSKKEAELKKKEEELKQKQDALKKGNGEPSDGEPAGGTSGSEGEGLGQEGGIELGDGTVFTAVDKKYDFEALNRKIANIPSISDALEAKLQDPDFINRLAAALTAAQRQQQADAGEASP